MVTAQEAKKKLLEIRKKSAERQKAYQEQMKAEGRKRITCWITNEAYQELEKNRKESGDNTGDIISNSLINNNKNVNSNGIQNVTVPRGTLDIEREELIAKIEQMKSQGMTLQQVADQLNSKGIKTPSGRGQWKKHTVDNLMKRKKGGK